ncbi:hypothetical protein O2K51_02690 [Apibacter raozihei]|uniref:hypothetical protein n=1 Tax=Apibacter TaxID=1778601 RepID=UPI000FE2F5B2|nr:MULTISPECIES: hypothetical protein [Apibacter]
MTTLLYIGVWPFAKFVGFLLFLTIALAGFWCLTFLISILPYWLTYGIAENAGKVNADVKPEDVKRKTLPQQEGIEVVYTK